MRVPLAPQPMDARRLLQRICARHGLETKGVEPLLPLVQRALASPAEVRDRILKLVDDNLSRKAGGDPSATPERLFEDLDEEVLMSVSRVLHDWKPSSRILDLGGVLPDLFPDGIEPGDLPL